VVFGSRCDGRENSRTIRGRRAGPDVLDGKRPDLLPDPVLDQIEIIRGQIFDRRAGLVVDDEIDDDEIDATSKQWGRLLLGWLSRKPQSKSQEYQAGVQRSHSQYLNLMLTVIVRIGRTDST
jgi:hypothetical protein